MTGRLGWLSVLLIVVGFVLFIDQLYLFGIPFGPILPDLSAYDPTGSPVVHHWMLGVILMGIGLLLCKPHRRRR